MRRTECHCVLAVQVRLSNLSSDSKIPEEQAIHSRNFRKKPSQVLPRAVASLHQPATQWEAGFRLARLPARVSYPRMWLPPSLGAIYGRCTPFSCAPAFLAPSSRSTTPFEDFGALVLSAVSIIIVGPRAASCTLHCRTKHTTLSAKAGTRRDCHLSPDCL